MHQLTTISFEINHGFYALFGTIHITRALAILLNNSKSSSEFIYSIMKDESIGIYAYMVASCGTKDEIDNYTYKRGEDE